MDALSGMNRLINKNTDLKIFVELLPSNVQRAGHSPEEFLHKLWDYNFSNFIIDERKKCLKYINNLNEVMAACEHGDAWNIFATRR